MRLLIQDIRRGVVFNKWKIVLGILLIVFLEIMFYTQTKMRLQSYKTGIIPGTWDVVFYMLMGMEEYIPGDKEFVLPYVWMSIQFICAFLVYGYVNDDLEGYGRNILLISRNRRLWWYSKCVWSFIMTLGVYVFLFLISVVISAFYGGGTEFTPQVYELLTDMEYNPDLSVRIKIFLMVVPCISSMALTLFQLLVSLISGPAVPLLLVMSVEVLSAYYTRFYLVGNYSMILRSNVLVPEGLKPSVGILISLTGIVIIIIAGGYLFEKKDILGKGEMGFAQ